ncbi:hypothetical protein BEWA_033980 [Theileria equi strain WA]|uniref:SAM-dependent MTase RsmB/NOP-type domain-containing protein n=1 Tax=Theileria equi strain WA TaxID=1537102 RepID=L0AZW3_THEEQ|nr:hypothetical protein BEWA_033980 [Theileria equi strain WA]AFZ80541.1 hypothetical protein BEWA_033980 [Theileria equi strain WA]|eukprot:XP_004830207.1 hypothetical protein BEWA_033980 [Theileria equi strain WA]
MEDLGENSSKTVQIEENNASSTKRTRLGWKSRCREMQGVRWNKKSNANQNKDNERRNYVEGVPSNPEFEEYYRAQKICKDEEWDTFMEYNRKMLPVSFRLNTSVPLWKQTIEKLKEMVSEDSELALRQCIDYSPEYLKPEDCIFYQMKTDKFSLRKNESFSRLHKFIMSEDNRGSLSRQETVSMLPVLFLDPQPNENILDLCAAPGMKYLQIIDIVESKLQFLEKLDSSKNKGIIIGNDICQNRVSTLSHHMKSLNSPSSAITNYDASRFPYLYNSNGEKILFDRILADMPCSCDGTLRKSIEIWKTWKPTNGLHMHKIQLSILKRAIQILKPGGLLIYSTCSLNPLENEAIASYIASDEGKELGVRLEPLKQIKGMKYATGVVDWFVPNPNGGHFEKYEQVDKSLHNRILPSMFKSENWNAETASLVRRILPHHNDTGGFFIFAIRKNTSGYSSSDQLEVPDPVKTDTTDVISVESQKDSKRKHANAGKLLHEFCLWKESDEDYSNVLKFYGIDKDADIVDQMIVKLSTKKSVYLFSKSDVVYRGYKRKNSGDSNNRYELCKYALAGTRIFTQLKSKTIPVNCDLRITQEGTKVLYPYSTRRKLFCNLVFGKLIIKGTISKDVLLEAESNNNLANLDSCKGAGGELESGGYIYMYKAKY